jgi:hypothetical protein
MQALRTSHRGADPKRARRCRHLPALACLPPSRTRGLRREQLRVFVNAYQLVVH